MRQCLLFALLLHFVSESHSQLIEKRTMYVSGSLSVLKPSTFMRDLNNHPLMVNLKAGYFVKRGLSISLEFQSTTYTEHVSGIARLQQPGSNYTEAGTITDRYISLGIASDFYAQLGKNFYVIPSVFLHYLHNSYTDKGEYYSNSQPIGMTYLRGADYGYYMRTGANLSLCYFVKPNVSFTLRCAEFDVRLHRKASDIYIAVPLMAGVQYFFKPKK